MENLATTVDDKTGLIKIGTFTGNGTSTLIVCDNVFSNLYQNYEVVITLNPAGINFAAIFGQFIDTAGTVVGSSYYSSLYGQDYASATAGFGAVRASTSVFYLGWLPSATANLSLTAQIWRPREAAQTTVSSDYIGVNSGSAFQGGKGMTMHIGTNQFRGFRIQSDTGSPNLSGTVRVYGYRN
jgi:hypothetical protein